MKKISFILLFFINTVLLFAQDQLDQELYSVEFLFVDEKFPEAETKLKDLEKKYADNKLNSVKINVRFAMLYGLLNEYTKTFQYANLAQKIANSTPEKLDDAYSLEAFARIYLNNQLPEKTVELANQALKILESYPKEYFLKSRVYSLLTMMHTRNGVYSKEYENYMNNALENAQLSKNPLQIFNSLTEKSIVSYAKHQQTKAYKDIEDTFTYTEDAIHYVERNKNTLPLATPSIMLYNNYSSLFNNYQYNKYSQTQKKELAEKYAKKAFELAEKGNIKGMQMAAYASYGQILENKNELKLAEEYYLKAYHLAKDYNVNKAKKVAGNISEIIAAYYKKQGNLEKALFYTEENLRFNRESTNQILDNKRKFLEEYYSSEQKLAQIKQLEEKNKIYTKQNILYAAIAISAISGIIFLAFMFYYKQKANKQKTNLLEAEKNETELTLQLEKEEKARLKAEQELLELQQEQLQKHALATSLQLNQKNSFLNELKEKVKDKDTINLDRILKDERLTDEDFIEIQNIVQDVHPNLFKRLNEVSKNKLSNLDLKYAAYIYLNMDNQQIANIMKIEPKTVRMAKYRMKQKIGLEKEIDLQTFIQNLEL